MKEETVNTAPRGEVTAFTTRVWVVVAGFLFVLDTIRAIYALAVRRLPSSFELLAWLGAGLLFAYLVHRDRRALGVRASPSDLGLLVLIAWPLAVPYHFFSTRGRRGWRPFVLFLGAYFGSYALSLLLFLLFRRLIWGS